MIRANRLTFFSLSSCRQRCHRSSIQDITFILAAAPSRFTQVNVLRRPSFPHESETATFREWP